jgi:hypothetical protein
MYRVRTAQSMRECLFRDAHDGTAPAGRLAPQGRIVEGLELLPQVAQITLPVAVLAEPGKRPREGRIEPAM